MKKVFIYSLLVVVIAAAGGRTYRVWADEAAPRQVQESADSINANQERIAEIRKYVEEFETLKADNARLIGRMEAFGWSYDWAKTKPVKLEDFQQRSL